MKYMYASADGGKTRLPVMVKLSDEPYSGTTSQGETINYEEMPLNIYVESKGYLAVIYNIKLKTKEKGDLID